MKTQMCGFSSLMFYLDKRLSLHYLVEYFKAILLLLGDN